MNQYLKDCKKATAPEFAVVQKKGLQHCSFVSCKNLRKLHQYFIGAPSPIADSANKQGEKTFSRRETGKKTLTK